MVDVNLEFDPHIEETDSDVLSDRSIDSDDVEKKNEGLLNRLNLDFKFN